MAKTELGLFIANKILHNFIPKGDYHELDHHGDEVKLSLTDIVGNFFGNGFFITCRNHGVNPKEWIEDVFNRVEHTKPSEYHTLFPQNWKKSPLN